MRLGQRQHPDETLYVRCREEIARLLEEGDLQKVVFDLSDFLILPSSALGLIAAVGQGEADVRVINASHAAREDFLMTGLHRIVELDPALNPPPK